jgi:hypothetical protein
MDAAETCPVTRGELLLLASDCDFFGRTAALPSAVADVVAFVECQTGPQSSDVASSKLNAYINLCAPMHRYRKPVDPSTM